MLGGIERVEEGKWESAVEGKWISLKEGKGESGWTVGPGEARIVEVVEVSLISLTLAGCWESTLI